MLTSTSFSLVISQIRVRMGEWDFSSTTEPHEHVERKVTKKVVHPKYNFFTYENDLALVRTEKRVRFQDNIIPICLPGNDDLLIGKLIIPCFGTISSALLFKVHSKYFNNTLKSWKLEVIKLYAEISLNIDLQLFRKFGHSNDNCLNETLSND